MPHYLEEVMEPTAIFVALIVSCLLNWPDLSLERAERGLEIAYAFSLGK
jgi:hypothetical protein